MKLTVKEYVAQINADETRRAKLNAAIMENMENVILPMATAEGVELTDEDLEAVSGGSISKPSTDICSVK